MAKKKGPIGTLRQQLQKERMADYRVTLSALAAGQANYVKQLSRYQKSLTGTTERQTQALLRLKDRAQQAAVRTEAQQQKVTVSYGAALGGAVAQAFEPARTSAEAAVKTSKAAVRVGREGEALAGDIVTTAKLAAQAQQSAAEYKLNEALQQRTIMDNQSLVDLMQTSMQVRAQLASARISAQASVAQARIAAQADIAAARVQQADAMELAQLNADLQLRNWQEQQDYATAQVSTQAQSQVQGIMTIAPDIAVAAADVARTYRDDNDGSYEAMPITDLSTAWAASQGYDPASPEYALFVATLRKIPTTPNTAVALNGAMSQLWGGLPGFSEWGPSVYQANSAGIVSALSQSYQTYLASVTSATGTSQPAAAGFQPFYRGPTSYYGG